MHDINLKINILTKYNFYSEKQVISNFVAVQLVITLPLKICTANTSKTMDPITKTTNQQGISKKHEVSATAIFKTMFIKNCINKKKKNIFFLSHLHFPKFIYILTISIQNVYHYQDHYIYILNITRLKYKCTNKRHILLTVLYYSVYCMFSVYIDFNKYHVYLFILM